jgi:hypothetical protein
MCAFANDHGVPACDIIIESEAGDSIENALYVAPMLMQMGVADVALVTSKFHIPRMKHYFESVLMAFAVLNHSTAVAAAAAAAALVAVATGGAEAGAGAGVDRVAKFTGHGFRLSYVGADDGYTNETRRLRLRKEELLVMRSKHMLLRTTKQRVCPVPCYLRRENSNSATSIPPALPVSHPPPATAV